MKRWEPWLFVSVAMLALVALFQLVLPGGIYDTACDRAEQAGRDLPAREREVSAARAWSAEADKALDDWHYTHRNWRPTSPPGTAPSPQDEGVYAEEYDLWKKHLYYMDYLKSAEAELAKARAERDREKKACDQ